MLKLSRSVIKAKEKIPTNFEVSLKGYITIFYKHKTYPHIFMEYIYVLM